MTKSITTCIACDGKGIQQVIKHKRDGRRRPGQAPGAQGFRHKARGGIKRATSPCPFCGGSGSVTTGDFTPARPRDERITEEMPVVTPEAIDAFRAKGGGR